MKVLDFHTHLDSRWFQQELMSTDAFLEGLDRCGVDKACVFTVMGFYEACPRHNDLLAERTRIAPERLIAFATVDPKLGRQAVEEAERCLRNPAFRGLKFHPWLQAFAPSMVQETLTHILKLAAHYHRPVLFHDGTPPYATSFQIAALARLVPEASIVLGHAGLADYVVAAGQLLRDIPNLYGCLCGPKAADLKYLLEMAGPEKVLFGSDFGLSSWEILAERLDNVTLSGVGQSEMRMILYDNAARLLRLEEKSGQ